MHINSLFHERSTSRDCFRACILLFSPSLPHHPPKLLKGDLAVAVLVCAPDYLVHLCPTELHGEVGEDEAQLGGADHALVVRVESGEGKNVRLKFFGLWLHNNYLRVL